MPLCTLQLLAFEPNTSLKTFLDTLDGTDHPKPLLRSLPLRWIIRPETYTDPLLNHAWSLLLFFEGQPVALPQSVNKLVAKEYSTTAGVPSAVLKNLKEQNARLIRPEQGDVPSLTGSLDKPRMKESSQALELNDDVMKWAKDYGQGGTAGGALSMLNFLAFHQTEEAKESYRKYGKAFATAAGSKRGGNAKVVGTVVAQGAKEWDEVAIAQYPSAAHFADMLASEDYQEVNHKYRLPALKDTCILATTEVRLMEDGLGMKARAGGAKL